MNDDARVLRVLIDQVAKQPVPEIDWDRVEHNLLDRIDRGAQPRFELRSEPGWYRLAGIAAVAAGIALAVTGLSQHPLARPAQAQVRVFDSMAAASVQGDELRPGDRLVATYGLTVDHPGRLSYALSAGSEAVVESIRPVVVVRLNAGQLLASVVPSSARESFVVRVDDTTVAVHGTRFVVEKKGDRALVHLAEGSVVVGSSNRFGPEAHWLMVAPSNGNFSLDGAKSAIIQASANDEPLNKPSDVEAHHKPVPMANSTLPRPSSEPAEPSPSRQPVAASLVDPKNPDSEPVAKTPSDNELPANLPEVLTSADAKQSLGALSSAIRECYRRSASRRNDAVTVTVRTSVTLQVAPDGHVTFARFNPPLTPDAQSCASSAVLAAQFPKARSQSTLELPLQF